MKDYSKQVDQMQIKWNIFSIEYEDAQTVQADIHDLKRYALYGIQSKILRQTNQVHKKNLVNMVSTLLEQE